MSRLRRTFDEIGKRETRAAEARPPRRARRSGLWTAALLSGFAVGAVTLWADAPKVPAGPYSNNLDKLELGKPPEEMLVLSGTFEIKDDAGNHFLELAGLPLDVDGLLFGPENAGAEITARICGTSQGKMHPEFGVGANDAGGFKLILLPGQGAVEIRKNDDSVAKVEYKDWKSGDWTMFKLRVSPGEGGKWKVEGKVWPAAGKEPEKWLLSHEEEEAPSPGRASLWGIPYADTPIRYDDLKATPVEAGK